MRRVCVVGSILVAIAELPARSLATPAVLPNSGQTISPLAPAGAIFEPP
jgi:hypothetical protein